MLLSFFSFLLFFFPPLSYQVHSAFSVYTSKLVIPSSISTEKDQIALFVVSFVMPCDLLRYLKHALELTFLYFSNTDLLTDMRDRGNPDVVRFISITGAC